VRHEHGALAYGELLEMEFKAGETLLESGTTGNFGGATVLTALAMGARCVSLPAATKPF
jgi:alcohol dehydrogenase